MKPLVIFGSSRSDGDTLKAIERAFANEQIELVDLTQLDISFYDYDGKNLGDDFIPLAERMVAARDVVLATPVYWYSMSAQLKVFMDRLSDLVSHRKELGRALAGKRIWVLAIGASGMPEGFEVPFRDTARYLNMEYKGICYLLTQQISSHAPLQAWGDTIALSSKNEKN